METLLNHPTQNALGCFFKLSDADLEVLAALEQRRLTIDVGENLLNQNNSEQTAFILLRGWAASHKILPDGSRQIIDFPIPGDILGFRCPQLQIPDHFIEPLTKVVVIEFKIQDFRDAMADRTQLARALSWFLARDYAIVVEHLVNIGRHGALERIGHFFLELGVRMAQANLGHKAHYCCPLTQYLLADALGLSAIHVNRTLRELREKNLLTFRGGQVVISDYKSLVDLTGFNPGYLIPR